MRPVPARALRRLSSGRPLILALLVAAALELAAHASPPAAAVTPPSAVPGAQPGATVERQKLVRRSLRSDTTLQYLLYVPAQGGAGAPVFVTAHGVSRNAVEHATLFLPHAARQGVVLVAPYFDPAAHEDYQRLGRKGRGHRADQVLDAIVAEVRQLTGARPGRIHLFGFSGGAQFAHRYAMAHPDRIARAVVTAAGWYTFPDSTTPYPYGTGPTPDLEGIRFVPEAYLRVPIKVLVGGADVGTKNLRQNPELDRQQGTTRIARARNWAAAMRDAARARGLTPLVSYEEVPGIEHSFRQFMEQGDLGDRVFGSLFGTPPSSPRPETPVPVVQGAGSR
jgi:pimeloyl-ACP methyl ester carboxylesterase